jgi:hypothetical protein
MRVILSAVIGLLLLVSEASAQKFTIKGQVIDSSKVALPSSTVMLLNQKDSTLVSFAASDAKGFFEMKNVSTGDFLLKVTFVGYATYQKQLSVKGSNSEMNVGLVRMMPQDRQLDELVIKGEKAPVTVKRDTIEFNAGSFKVKANANVEDLLKKLPGVEVETDGTVRAQGEQVQRVMVDGREFFGRDPKLATRNLPADAVEKVQVFDKKSDQSVFTGIEDGQKEKTINLELKEEKRNGAFGTMMAGAGSNDRFQAKANINRFAKGIQLSFLGMANNINEQGFSFGDFMNFTGGSQQMMGGGGGRVSLQIDGNNTNGVPLNFGGRQNGIMTNYAGGINFNKDLSKNTQLTSSYFYNRLDQDIRQKTNRINYLPNGTTYLFDQNSSQVNTNDNHRVNLNIDHKIDSANSLKFSNSLTYSESGQRSITKSQTYDPNNVLQNESDRNNINSQITTNLNSSLLLRHRFAKKGRSLSANVTLGISQTDSKSILNSDNQFFGTNPSVQEVDQRSVQSNANQSYGGTLTYIEPLGGRKYLEASYSYRINKNQADRKMYNEKGAVGTLIDSLTNNYNSNYVYNRPGINFRINRTKFNLAVGASYQNTRLEGTLYSMKTNQFTNIDRTFENFLPVLRFNYDFSNFKHLRLDYETSMQEPTIQQLQPIVDYSDPLNLSTGNPELRPGYVHSISANFTTFDPAKFINFFGFLTAVYTTNAISTSQTINPTNFVRTTKPVNVNDNLALNANFSFGFPVRKLNSRFSLGPTGNYSNGINLLNDQENRTRQTTLGGSVRYNYTFKEILIVDLSANLSKQQTQYDFNQKQNQSYFNKTYTAEVNLTFLKNYQFNTAFNYYTYTSETTNFSQEIPILNIGLSRFLLKNNVGELKIGVNNLLDQSLSVNQTATANYLQQTTYNNLGRYFMVSFTYALNKQLNPMGGGRRGRPGGMQMIISN